MDAAHDAIDHIFDGAFGAAGAELVIEEFMTGEEASFFVLCDGRHALPLATAQDHKRVGDADTGPNTGGMGAYSPSGLINLDIGTKIDFGGSFEPTSNEYQQNTSFSVTVPLISFKKAKFLSIGIKGYTNSSEANITNNQFQTSFNSVDNAG